MDARIPRIADTTMLFVAVVLGTVMAPAIAFVGLPIAAAGIAGLAYRGATMPASLAAATGVAVVGLLDPSQLIYIAPVIAAVVLTVVLLPGRSFQSVAALLVAVIALASFAGDTVAARQKGTTLSATIAQQSASTAAEMTKALGASASADTLRAFKEANALIVSAWPSLYFQVAVFVSILVLFAISWAARRVGRSVNVPKLSRLDLSPHVLWPFVVGLVMLAASYASFPGSTALGVVGLNFVLCVRTLFLLQGIGVAAGVLDRAGVGLGGRILALAALAALDALTFAVSFTGLLDFWVNFRRLPREATAPIADADPDGRRW